ncbi:MAG: hypothetical protein D4R73_07515 [Deltaproteobacteria bacterium]|nr:MAG: hypothetical protein D4R73_07515 [Deltaproteobacteria bacterium]
MDSPGGITALRMLQSRTAATGPEDTKLWRCSSRGGGTQTQRGRARHPGVCPFLILKAVPGGNAGPEQPGGCMGAKLREHLFLRGGTPRAYRQAHRGRPGGGPGPCPRPD